ncbi:hypothetical protein [Methylobacterium sp. Leaf125]|nr:hypothetical protein [Methylobacterium sp. Leaf125]
MQPTPQDYVACLAAYLLLSALVGRTFWLLYLTVKGCVGLTWKGPRR